MVNVNNIQKIRMIRAYLQELELGQTNRTHTFEVCWKVLQKQEQHKKNIQMNFIIFFPVIYHNKL